MRKTFVLAAAFAAGLTGTMAAHASTVTVGAGQTVCDSITPTNREGVPFAGTCDLTVNDFGEAAAIEVDFDGTGSIYGFVADQGDGDRYADALFITLSSVSEIFFSLVGPDTGFTASLALFDATTGFVGAVNDTSTTPFSLGTYGPGTYTFVLDAEGPDDGNRLGTNYLIDVAAVPLPAGAVLLLGAFGGLAALRRRKTA